MLRTVLILAFWLAWPLAAEVTRSGAISVLPKSEAWTHLELGAANYRPGNPSAYGVLNDFLDEYVKLNGSKGTLLLNDLKDNADSLETIATALRERASAKGWKDLKVDLLPGDFTKLSFPRKLNTIALRNPEAPEITTLKDLREVGDFYSRLAAHTTDGLLLTSYFYLEMAAIKEVGGVKMESHGRGQPYKLQNGWTVPNPTFNFLVAGKNPPPPPPAGAGETADDALYEKSIRFGKKDSLSGFIITNLNLQPDEGFLSGVRTRLRAFTAVPRSKAKREDADHAWLRLHYTLERITSSSQETLIEHIALLGETAACGPTMAKLREKR